MICLQVMLLIKEIDQHFRNLPLRELINQSDLMFTIMLQCCIKCMAFHVHSYILISYISLTTWFHYLSFAPYFSSFTFGLVNYDYTFLNKYSTLNNMFSKLYEPIFYFFYRFIPVYEKYCLILDLGYQCFQ